MISDVDPWFDPGRVARVSAVLGVLGARVGLDVADLVRVRQVVERACGERAALDTAELVGLGLPDVGRCQDPSPQRAAFEAYVERFSWALNQARSAGPAAGGAAWWLGHRWLARFGTTLTGLDSLSETEQALVTVADTLAVPVDALGDMLGDHLGTVDPVTGDQVGAALDALGWSVDDETMTVTTTTAHPAVHVAISEYLAGVSGLLVSAQRRPGLGGLPLVLDAQVTAVTTDQGPAFVAAGMRFALAHDRVRDLLMGENLYGDKWLALREMYQNAVDACRLAQARYTYLARTGDNPATDEPDERLRIDFRQGTDDGRPYVECTDTGVGMDLTQISTAFCQAGIRAADLPGYVAELNDYAAATPPIELWTNSRFGIGVLSYFMLAHAVEVHTTRLHRDGTLGHTYRVLIPGPGACFRVQDLGPGTAPGTTVRLWLTNNDDAHESTVAKLEAVVAVAVFPLAARDTSGTYAEWQPGQLTEAFGGRENVIASARHGVWWVHPSGKILSDGIVTSENSRHCFVNLTGRHAPRLSVDRKEIIELDRGRLHALKLDAVDDLLAGPTKIRDSIIKNLIPSRFADEVVTRARARRVVIWRMSAVVGATDMLQAGLYNSDLPQGPTTPVTAWRASAALAATRKPGELDVASWPQIVVPLPSDDLLASVLWATDDLPLSQVASWAHVVATAAQWDREPREVAARYAELGYHVQDGAGDLRLTNQDRMLLKELELAPTVSLDSIADAADATKMTLPQAHSRLTALGIPCEPLRDIATLTRWERELTRARNAPLSAFTITQIAGRAQVPAAAVHQRAQELGVPVDPLPTVSSRPMEVLCSRDLTGSREIAPNQITLLHAACAARVFGMPVERMLAYAQELGANLPDPHGQCPSVPANLPFWVRTAAAVSTATLADLATARHSAQALVDLLRWAQVEIVGPQISDLDSVDTALVCASTELGPDEEGYDEWDERWAALGAADATTPLNPFAVARVAARLDLGTQQAVERLSRMGYRIAGQVPEPTPRNLYAARRRHPVAEWFAPGDIVPLTAVLRLVHKHRLTIDQALTVYRDLGLDPEDPRDLLPVVRPGDGLPDRTRRR